MRKRPAVYHVPSIPSFLFLLLFPLLFFPSAELCGAEEPPLSITADHLEYFSGAKKYVASGSVVIERGEAVIKADKVTYHDDTSFVIAEGNVRYDDEAFSITAEKAEVNLEQETGVLLDAEVFYRRDNYRLRGERIEKRSKTDYFSPDASFTTCDALLPAWCFRGKDVDTIIGDRIKAKDVTFRVKGYPVLYSPYLWASIPAEKQTGFLRPTVGHSNSRGLELSLPFYWYIAENRDATFVLDAFSRRGLGTGLEYRFVKPEDIRSDWWVYHIRDSETKKSFFEATARHENRFSDRLGGFLSINYVNEKEFYREFNPYREVRTQRFLESTGEIAQPFSNSRLYLLSQYWVDLKEDTEDVPQRLPELGYVLNFSETGNFLLGASMDISHFWRDEGLSVVRADLFPRLLHSMGKDFVITQKAALRGTSYAFYQDAGDSAESVLRSAFEYDIVGHTRLYRPYASFIHVIEPALRFHYITSSENKLPLFDSHELFEDTSRIEFSILNRGFSGGNELFTARLLQAIDLRGGDRPFLPLRLEAGVQYPLPLKAEVNYNVHTGKVETVTSELGARIAGATLSFGQRYHRQEDVMMYTAGAAFSVSQSLQFAGNLWYDAEDDDLRDLTVTVRYLRQCWGVRVEAVKKPGDFTVRFLIELLGLGSRA